ncbi:MAG TPA: CerR family C-terminal domain-containing protein [Candidatus Brocadiia bacterium]|nr:CerR family C-terminal domain-containing protein [Candidatus Brocadiia bacterium]
MSVRKDGEETRRKIMEAACSVFGEKGYRDATHAEICRLAGVNTAAINYHFRSKDALYKATWEHVADEMDKLYPIDGGAGPDAPADEKLKAFVRAMLMRILDDKMGHFHRLRMMEIVNPTGLIDEALDARIRERREYTLGVIAELLGPKASREDLEMCEMSLVSQCRMIGHKRPGKRRGPPWNFTFKDVDRLSEHIALFSLAGMKAVRERIEAG